jgi:hypothetical protein
LTQTQGKTHQTYAMPAYLLYHRIGSVLCLPNHGPKINRLQHLISGCLSSEKSFQDIEPFRKQQRGIHRLRQPGSLGYGLVHIIAQGMGHIEIYMRRIHPGVLHVFV